jgi:hypothetical protein
MGKRWVGPFTHLVAKDSLALAIAVFTRKSANCGWFPVFGGRGTQRPASSLCCQVIGFSRWALPYDGRDMTLFISDAVDASSAPIVDRLGEGPMRYVRAALAIARMDTEVMVVISRDRQAIWYGVALTAITAGWTVMLQVLTTRSLLAALLTLIFVPAFAVLVSALSTAAIHGAAKIIFGATGTYVGVLRVLWLGSLVGMLAIVPVLGQIVSGLWSTLIMMVTFQEVDGIDRIQALGLSLALNAAIYLIGIGLFEALRFQAS